MAAAGDSPTPLGHGTPPRPAPGTIVLVVGEAASRAEIRYLCECIRVLLATSDADVVICDVGALAAPDAVAVDALARMQLTARRLGCSIRLRHAGEELTDLLTLVGLYDVVPRWTELRRGPRGQTEEREEPRGVEKERHPGDPPG